MALVVVFLHPWPLVSAYFWGFCRGMSSMKADKLVREKIAEELELISVTATSSGRQATTQQRWDRIYPFLKQLGWKYRKGGLDRFLYQPPGSPQWLSCEAAATSFSKSLPEGVTLVYGYSHRGVTRGKTLASTPTAAASTGGVHQGCLQARI